MKAPQTPSWCIAHQRKCSLFFNPDTRWFGLFLCFFFFFHSSAELQQEAEEPSVSQGGSSCGSALCPPFPSWRYGAQAVTLMLCLQRFDNLSSFIVPHCWLLSPCNTTMAPAFTTPIIRLSLFFLNSDRLFSACFFWPVGWGVGACTDPCFVCPLQPHAL